MVGFGSDGRTHTVQPGASGNDLASTVTSAVSSLGNLIKSQLPSSNREVSQAMSESEMMERPAVLSSAVTKSIAFACKRVHTEQAAC